MKKITANAFRRLACPGLLILLTAGCAGNGDTIPAPTCPVPGIRSSDYLIGPGDIMNVVVWRNEQLSVTLPVRPDGKISTPLVDDMQAAGKTPSQLSDDIESVLSEYLRTPEVSIIVTEQGASNQIQIVGEVASPQPISYRDDLRMLDLMVAVGGLTDFAAGNRTNLVRQAQIGQIECRVRVKDLLAGDMSQNIEVFPGDVVVVPKARF